MEDSTLFLIWLCYGIPAILFAMLLILLMALDSRFISPFYRLMQCNLTIDILCYLNTWLLRIENSVEFAHLLAPIYHYAKPVLNVSTVLTHWFFHAQSGCLLMLFIFRYTLTRFPKAAPFWKKYYPLAYVTLLMYATALLIPFVRIHGVDVLTYDEVSRTFSRDVSSWATFGPILKVESGVYISATIAFSIATTRNLANFFSTGSPTLRVFRYKMFRVLALDMLTHLFILLWEYLHLVTRVPLASRMIVLFAVSDVMSLSTPIWVFFFDDNVVKAFWWIVCCLRGEETSSSLLRVVSFNHRTTPDLRI